MNKGKNLVHDSGNFSSSPCLKSKSFCKAACLALGGKYFWKKEVIKRSGLSMDPGGNLLNQALASPFSEKGKIFVTKYLCILKSSENKARNLIHMSYNTFIFSPTKRFFLKNVYIG